MPDEFDWRALRIARAWGVSPSRFLGEERAQTVTYIRDDAGRVVSARIIADPEWSADDRRLAFALEDYEARLCGGCGDDLTETTDPENQGAYEPLPALLCHRCEERRILEKQKEKLREEHGEALKLNVRKILGWRRKK